MLQELYSRCPHCKKPGMHREESLGFLNRGMYFEQCPSCKRTHEYDDTQIWTAGSLLELETKCCDKPSTPAPAFLARCSSEREQIAAEVASEADAEFELKRVKCGNRYCERCTEWRGIELRERLRDRMADWTGVIMLTLTVDPTLWEGQGGAEACYKHTQSKRSISKLIRELLRLGELDTKHYFSVIEWQKNGYPHWHIIVQTGYIDIGEVGRIWGLNRPSHAPAELGYLDNGKERPAFGFVSFSKRPFVDGSHAANYITKYLIKPPKVGYPEWVLSQKRLPRYSTSRGFWGTTSSPKPEHDPTCFCETCRGESAAKKRVEKSTIAERIDQCETSCCVVKTTTLHGVTSRAFFGACQLPWAEIIKERELDPNASVHYIPRHAADRLCGYEDSIKFRSGIDPPNRPAPRAQRYVAEQRARPKTDQQTELFE